MQTLSLSKYNALTEGAEILASDYLDGQVRPKVLRLRDQSILKLFRLKRYLSSARLVPYATRFQRHAERLEAFDIPTVGILAVFKIAELDRTAVHYRPLEGPTLRDYCKAHPLDGARAQQLGGFWALLHHLGIYFRSIHFGNMVLTTDHRIGLIDVVDMRFKKGPLGTRRRIRNLRHLFRYKVDIDALAPVRDRFFEAYRTAAGLHPVVEGHIRRHFEAYFQKHGRQLETPVSKG